MGILGIPSLVLKSIRDRTVFFFQEESGSEPTVARRDFWSLYRPEDILIYGDI
jgi:hypothetical protein